MAHNKWPSKDIHAKYLEPVSVTLFGKRIYADVNKPRILRRRVYPGLSWGILNPMVSVLKREAEGDVRQTERREDSVKIGEVEMMCHKLRNAKDFQQPLDTKGEAWNGFFSRASERSRVLPTP